MAAGSTPDGAARTPAGPPLSQFLIALVVVTVLAGPLGAVVAPHSAPAARDQATKDAATGEGADEAAIQPTSNLFDLPPIVTNLGSPREMWVRLETSMIFDSSALKHPETFAAEIANDILAYLRTVSMSQIEGPIGLQNLRQELNERASIRSNGAVKELVIRTLVVQ
jgi:flagellar FliL protein